VTATEAAETSPGSPSAPAPPLQSRRERLRRLTRIQELGLAVVLIALAGYFSAFAPGFDSSENIKTIFIYLSVLGVLSVGETLVILAGGFDLSNGAVLAFASSIGATILADGGNQVVATVATLGVALGIGFINGILVAVLRVNAFIATLGTYLIFSGAAYVYTNSQTVNFPLNEWVAFGRGNVGFVPTPVIILLVLSIIAALVLRYTVFGRSLYAMGGNPQAARLAGIPVKRYLVMVFAISGLSAGVGALIQASLGAAGSATYTGQLNLQSITAVILGGAALTGGEGGVVGTLFGVVITQTILDGLTLMNISEFYQDVVTGIVLLFAVMLASTRQALAGRKLRLPAWVRARHG
jgi:ribose transport system permease protein